MTTAPTKGPWSRDKYGHVVDATGKYVQFRSVGILCAGDGVAEAEANTDLAAAAPCLLAALQELLTAADNLDPQSGAPIGYGRLLEAVAAADLVILKATGEPA